MYNGIGLQTARGTGTSGYVQANLSALNFSKHKKAYNAEPDIQRAEASVNIKPNAELLDHEYKRRIEIRCVEFEDLMENEGLPAAEIDQKVNEYRKLLLSDFEAGRMDLDDELDLRNTHSRRKVAKDNRDRMRNALGISSTFVDGTSMAGMKKPNDPEFDENPEDPEITLKKKIMEEMKAEKAKKRLEKGKKSDESSSDSSSTSDSSESSSESEVEVKKRSSKKVNVKSAPAKKKHRKRSSSSSSSSDSDSSASEKRHKKKKVARRDSPEDNKPKVREEPQRSRRESTDYSPELIRHKVASVVHVVEHSGERSSKRYRDDSSDRRRRRSSDRDRYSRKHNRRDSPKRRTDRRQDSPKAIEVKQEPDSD